MLLTPDEEVEQEGQSHEDYLGPKNRIKFAAVAKLQTLRGTNVVPGVPDDNNSVHSNQGKPV